MKKNTLKTFVAMASLGLLGASSGTLAASASSTTNATVVAPIAIKLNAAGALEFGTFAPTGTPGSVTINAQTGERTVSNVVDLSSDAGQEGTYDVTGSADATYAVTLPAPVTLTDSVSSQTMEFTPSYYSATAASGSSATLSGTGDDTLTVGGVLTVGADQTAGTYSGSYDVTVEYN